MIKFPALVMARDLLQHGDEEAGRAARRVIVTLAAIEQAHVIYQEMLPPSVREEVFRGVPLDVLAALLDEPGRSARLVGLIVALQLQVGAVMVFHLRQIVGYPCGLDLVRQ